VKSSAEDFWKALEAERHDSSWRKPPTKYQPVCTLNHNIPKREAELWFHAGRHNAGARDADAMRGYRYALKMSKK
jgi:hypothetical protein